MTPLQLYRSIPFIGRPFDERDQAISDRDALRAECNNLRSDIDNLRGFLDTNATVLQYRQAYYEAHGHIAPGAGLPVARAYPRPNTGLSYKQKLTGLMPIADGRGAEIGPLNIPLLSKEEANVLYVDHLNTAGLREKYPTLDGIVNVDRPMINNNMATTLESDAPLDYIIASQVFEHVPNPIRWLSEAASVLRLGGLLSLSLPDRRITFDLLREETHASDIVAAYLEDAVVPNARSVYDHHSQASFVNMHWATPLSFTPEEIVAGRGSIKPKIATDDHLSMTSEARAGKYFDVHAWVYTPPNFLIIMATLASDGFIPFRCYQFYPTDFQSGDRGSSSFTIVLEKVDDNTDRAELRASFLPPLGEV